MSTYRKRHTPEQIVRKLGQADTLLSAWVRHLGIGSLNSVCWENSVAENWSSPFKAEFHHRFGTYRQAGAAIMGYIPGATGVGPVSVPKSAADASLDRIEYQISCLEL